MKKPEPKGVPEVFKPKPGEEPRAGNRCLIQLGGKTYVFKGDPGTPVKTMTDELYCGEE